MVTDIATAMSSVSEGDLLWSPTAERIAGANVTAFRQWLKDVRNLDFQDYPSLWQWSVSDHEGFWSAIWEFFDIQSDTPVDKVLSSEDIFEARWFEGTYVNYAEHLLRHEAAATPDEIALCHSSEIRPIQMTSWSELGRDVRILATRLRSMGIVPGDRIVSYMPNVLETAVAMLATVAIGAVWSSAAPEFGAKTVMERFGQIAPKLAFVSDGYSFNGKLFDRRPEISQIVAQLPSVEALIFLPYLGLSPDIDTHLPILSFDEMLSGPAVDCDDFTFTRVPSDHPLWILFSSGTTGLPKAIIHPHGGITAEHLKVMSLHCDLRPGKRMFFYTTTGWMMWNAVISALITGASAVLYDGSPVHGGMDMLWRMAQDTRTTLFGASPTLVQTMKKEGIRPRDLFDLSALEAIIVGGAPSTPETFTWFYDAVGDDIWVSSQSGGTEICSGLALGVPTLPVYAGELQVRALGMDVHVWDETGAELIDATGELVVTSPMPSAPLTFWGENGRQRYFDSYFEMFPGVWRHGDLAKINSRGGVYIYGRSDSTLNRFGVRIGSAEIYRVLEQVPGVQDSLVVCCETPGGGFYMPLFVSLTDREFTEDLKREIATKLRLDASPRHVPDEIYIAPAIPYTLTGKKMEVPIRKLIMGMPPEKAASRDAMANPLLLDWYAAFADSEPVRAKWRQPA